MHKYLVYVSTEVNNFINLTVDPKEPLCIFSKPTAKTQSDRPPETTWFAMCKADEPVAQLLLTLKIGIPVNPIWYKARCPQVESPN